jgi:hypothetical protein
MRPVHYFLYFSEERVTGLLKKELKFYELIDEVCGVT